MRTHSEKTVLLTERFFLHPPADLIDILDYTFRDDTFLPTTTLVLAIVTEEDVVQVLYYVGAWKALGEDLLPVGFLKAYRPPLY